MTKEDKDWALLYTMKVNEIAALQAEVADYSSQASHWNIEYKLALAKVEALQAEVERLSLALVEESGRASGLEDEARKWVDNKRRADVRAEALQGAMIKVAVALQDGDEMKAYGIVADALAAGEAQHEAL